MSLLEGAHWNTEPVVSGAAPASSPGHSWSRVPGKPPAVRRARESAANNRLRIGTAVMRLTPPLIVVQFIIGSLLAMCLNQEHQITSQATFIEATNRQDKSPTDVPMAIGQQRQQNQRPHRNGLPEERVIPVARRGYYRDQATRRRATAAAVSTARPELIVHRSRAESQLPDRDPTGMGELDDALNLISSSAPKRRPHWRLNPAIERSSTTSFKLLPERHNRFLTLEEDDDDDVNSMEKDDYETASSMADSDKLNGRSFNGRQTDRALHESSSPAGSTSGGAAAAVKTMSSSPATRGRRHQLLQQAPPPTAPMPILNEHQRQHIKTRLEIQRAEQAYRNKLMELKQRYLTNRAITDRAYYILLTIYAILITFGTISNSLICLTVIFKPKILSPRNIFIVNLAGSDLLLCVFTMPLTFIEVSMKIWQMGLIPCKLVAGLQATSIFVSTISITAIALDRYKVIVYPTHQETASGTRGALLLLASVWIGALSLSLPLFTYRTVEHHEITSPQIQSDPFQARSSNEALASQTTQSVLSAAIDYHNNNLNSNNHHNHNHNPNNSSSTTTSGTIRSSSPMQYVSASALTTTMASTAVSAGAPNAAGVSVTMPMMPMMMSNNTTTTGSGIVSSSKQYPNQLVDSFDFCIEAWPFAHGRGIFSVISMILQYVLPITIVSFVYTKISRKLQKRLIRRQRLTQLECQQKRQLNLIKRTHTMLVSVSLVFGLSWLPLNLMNVASDFSSEFRQFFDDQTFRIIFAVCHLIGCSSACSNPILYGFLNENFRKEFHQVYNHHARILMRRIRRLVAWLNCCWLTRKLFRRCASSRLDLREGGRTGGVGVGDAGTSVGDGDGDNDDEDYEYYAQGHNMVDSGAGVGGLRRNNRQVHNKRKLPNNNSYSVANGNDDDDVANNSSSSSSGANYLRGRNGADYDDEDEDDNNDRNNNNNDDYGDDDSDYDYEDNSSAFTSNSYTGGSSSAVFSSSSSSSIGSAGARVTQHRRKQPIAHFSSLNVIPLNELSLNIDRTGGGAPASGATHVNERAASHAELLASGGCAIGSNQEHGQSKTLEDGGPVPRSWSRNGSQMGKPPRQTNPPNSQQQSPQLKAATQNAARLTMMAAASENEMVAYEEVVAYDEMVVGANNSNSNSNNNSSNNKTLDDDKRRRLSHQTVTSVSGGRQTLGGRTMRLCLCISSSSSAETLGGMGAAQGPVSISIPNGLEQSDAAVVTTARRQDGDGGDGDDDGAPAQNGRIMQAIARDSAENNNDDDGLTKPAASQHQDRHQHQRQGQRHRDHQGLLGQAATLASDEMRRRGRLRRRRKQRMRQRLIQLECECQCHKEELELKVKKEKEKEKEKAGEMRAIIGSEPTTTGSMGQVRQGRQALPELMLPPPPADYDTRSESRSKRPGLVQCQAAFTGRRVWLRFLGVGGSGSDDTVDGPVDGGPQTIGATGDNGGGTKETNNNNSEPEGAGSRSIAPPGEQQQQQTPSDGNQLRPDTTTTATDSRQPLKRSQSDLEHQWRVVEHKRGDPTSGVGPSRANDGGNKQQSTIERNQSSGTESVVYQQQKRQHCNNCKHSSVSSSGVAATAARLMMASSGTSGQRRPSRKHHHPHAHRHHHHHHQHRQRSHHRRGPSSRPSTAAANPSGGSDGGTAAARAGGGPKADLARQRTKTLAVPQTVGAASGCGGAVGAAAPQVQKKRPLSISSWMSSLRRRKSVSSNQEAASAPSNSSRSESMTRQRSGAAQAQDTPTILVKSSDSRSPTSTMAACAIPPPPPNNTPRQQSSPFSLRNNARQQQKQQQRKQQQQQQQLTGPVGKGTFCLAPGSTGASKQVGTVYLSIEMADRKRADSVFSFDNQREKSTSVVVMLADDDDEEEEDYYRKGPAGGKGGAESSLGAPTSGPPPLALDKLSGSSGHRLDDGCAAAAAAEIGVEQTAGSVDAKIAGPAVSKPGFHTGRAAGGGAPPASLRYHTGMINSNQRSQTNESPGSEQTSSGSLRLVGGGAATNEREPANQTTMTTTTTTMTQNFGPPCTGRSGRAGSNNAPGGGGVCNQINNASDYLSGKDEAEEQEPARSSSATSLRNQLAHQPPTGKTRSAASCPRDTATKLATKTPNLPQLQLQSQQPPPPPTISTGMQESKFIDCSHEEANVDGQKLASSEKEEESDDAVMSHGSEQQERRRQQQRQTNQSNNNKHQHQKRQHDAPVQLDTDAGRGGSDVLVSNESHALQEEQQQQQQQQQDEDNNDRELRADPSSKGSPPCLSQTIDSSNSSNSSSSSASSASGSISPLSALSYTSACLSHHSSSVSSCTCSLTASSFSSGQLNATTTTTTTRDSSISISTPATTNNSYHQQHHHNQQQQQRHNHQRHFTEARAVGGGTLQQSTAISSSQHNMTTKTAGNGHRNEMTGSFADTSGCSDLAAGDRKSLAAEKEPLGAGMERQQRNQQQQRLYLRRLRTHSATLGNELGRSARTAAAGAVANTAAARKPSNLDSSAGLNANTNTNATTITTNHTPHHIKDAEQAHRNSHSELVSYSNSSSMAVLLTQAASTTQERLKPAANMSETAFSLEALDGGAPPPPLASPGSRADQASCKLLTENKFTGLAGGVGGEQRNRVATTNKSSRRLSTQSPQVDATAAAVDKCSSIPSSLTSTTQTPSRPFSPGHKIGPSNTGPSINNNNTDEDNNKTGLTNHTSASRLSLGSSGSELMMTTADEADS